MNQLLYVVLLYAAVQMLESYLVLPLVQLRTVWLPPVLSILAVVLMGVLAGMVGVLVAAPLCVALMVLVKMLYVEDWLGDRDIEVPGEAAA